MTARTLVAVGALLLAGSVVVVVGTGCLGTLWLNQTGERSGDVTVVFNNGTPYRASFSYGSYDALDRNPPGPVDFQQLRLEGNTASASITVTCRRNLAIGTLALYQRALDTKATQTDAFDPDAFDTEVHFSDAAKESELAAKPTVGTASGDERLLNVDYHCRDQLVYTFVEDAAAPGRFRIDFALIPARQP